MDLDGARSAVEQASTGLAHPAHRAASEATLLEFRRSPHALPACRHILQTSSVMEACFQAAATLRDAALRDWSALPPEERAGLRQFCLGIVLGQGDASSGAAGGGCPASSMPVVVSQLVSVLAVLIKRAWLDVDETKLDTGATQADYVAAASAAHAHRQSMLAEAERAVSQASNTYGARVIGLNLFAAVITEFAPSTASAMQLPWDFHERCRVSLQNDFLLSFFQHAVGTAKAAASDGGALSGADGGVCVAALRLMNGALAWDFQFTGANPNGGGFGLSANARGDARASDGLGADAVKIAPGASWRDALLAPGNTDWVFELHAMAAASALEAHNGAAHKVAHASRQTVSSLCALAGDVFPSKREDPTESLRLAHFARCCFSLNKALRPARQVINSAAKMGGDAEEVMTDGARGIAALASIHAPGDFYQPPTKFAAAPATFSSDAAGGSAALAATLGELTVCLLEAGALRSENDGGSLDETLRMCIEAWGALAERSLAGQQRDDAFRSNAGGANTAARPAHSPEPVFPGQAETSAACASVFEAYLRFGLDAAAAAAHEEDDGHEEEGKAGAAALDERLALAASVARAAPDETLPLLRSAMEAKKNELGAFFAISANSTNAADPSALLEQLWWLARVVPHVLCDAFEGEFPLPPDSVAECARRAAINNPGGLCPVTETGTAFLNLVGLCLDENAVRSGFVSPRLVEQLIWGAARWTDTYLMPEDVGGSAHAALFGGAVPTLAVVGLGGDGEGRVRGGAAKNAASLRPSPFSEAGGGVNVVDALLRVSLVALTAFPGEESAQRVAAKMLLPALTRRRALCRACVASASWAQVADAMNRALSSDANALLFPPEIHRFVAEALCRAAEGVADEGALDLYVRRALSAAGEALVRCASSPEDMKHPRGEARAVAVLEALRGAARASAARSQRAVFHFFSSHFEALLQTQILGKESAQVSKASLRLCEAFVEAQACFLQPSHAAALCAHTSRVIKTYKDSGRGVLLPAAVMTSGHNESSNLLRAERAREAYKEVKALLRVLTHVSSVDAESDEGDAAYAAEAAERGGSMRGGSARGGGAFAGVFGPGGTGSLGVLGSGGIAMPPNDRQAAINTSVDVPSVVLAGLDAVIPLLTEELLRFPKLCHQYFTLLAHMLEAYPGKVAALDYGTFATLMRTLEFGLTHNDVDIGRESFAALAALAAFHHQETKSLGANGGLGGHNAPRAFSSDASEKTSGFEEGILARFLRLSLNRLLFEDASASLAEPAADALLPLILCEKQAFERVANELINSLANDARASRAVGDALRDLTANGGLTDRVDRANKRRFRRNVSAFVLETRAFVRRN